MRYPCSYMIYSEAFDGMPDQAREAAYKRMWHILSGEEKTHKYSKLSLADRHPIVEVLRDTKKALPEHSELDTYRCLAALTEPTPLCVSRAPHRYDGSHSFSKHSS